MTMKTIKRWMAGKKIEKTNQKYYIGSLDEKKSI